MFLYSNYFAENVEYISSLYPLLKEYCILLDNFVDITSTISLENVSFNQPTTEFSAFSTIQSFEGLKWSFQQLKSLNILLGNILAFTLSGTHSDYKIDTVDLNWLSKSKIFSSGMILPENIDLIKILARKETIISPLTNRLSKRSSTSKSILSSSSQKVKLGKANFHLSSICEFNKDCKIDHIKNLDFSCINNKSVHQKLIIYKSKFDLYYEWMKEWGMKYSSEYNRIIKMSNNNMKIIEIEKLFFMLLIYHSPDLV